MANLNKQSVKKTGRARKETLVAELTEKLDAANGLVFTDYKGITHQQLETLKRELKKDEATMIIAKNSLMKLSLGNSKNYADAKDNESIEGPMATLLIKGDMVEPLKKLQKAAKESGLPKVKFGVLEGQILDEEGVLTIASLPGREALLTQLAAMLNSPIQGFTLGLNSIPQKFVMTLDAIAKAKPSDASSKDDKPASDSAVVSDATDTTPATEDKEDASPKNTKEESAEQIKDDVKTTEVDAKPETNKNNETEKGGEK